MRDKNQKGPPLRLSISNHHVHTWNKENQHRHWPLSIKWWRSCHANSSVTFAKFKKKVLKCHWIYLRREIIKSEHKTQFVICADSLTTAGVNKHLNRILFLSLRRQPHFIVLAFTKSLHVNTKSIVFSCRLRDGLHVCVFWVECEWNVSLMSLLYSWWWRVFIYCCNILDIKYCTRSLFSALIARSQLQLATTGARGTVS